MVTPHLSAVLAPQYRKDIKLLSEGVTVTATGPEGTAWSCVRGGAAGGWGKGLHQKVVRPWSRLLRAAGMELSCWNLRSIWAMLSDTGFDFLGGPVWSQELGPFQRGIFYEFEV